MVSDTIFSLGQFRWEGDAPALENKFSNDEDPIRASHTSVQLLLPDYKSGAFSNLATVSKSLVGFEPTKVCMLRPLGADRVFIIRLSKNRERAGRASRASR